MAIKTYNFQDGKGGLVKDSSSFSLSDNEWNEMLNIRIRNRAVSRIEGETSELGLISTPAHSEFVYGSSSQFFAYIDTAGKTYTVNADGTGIDITKQDGGVDVPLATGVKYQMNTLNGGFILMVNDGVNAPEYISTVGAAADTDNLMDLPDWEYDTNYTNVSAGIIRPFKNVLVAGNIKQTLVADGTEEHFGGSVRVSNQAAAGSLPTWDTGGDNADTADEFLLSDNGTIREMISLGNNLMVFTDDDIYSINITNRNDIPVVVSHQLNGRGILSSDCVVEIFGKLFVVGTSDIYLFQGGANAYSIAEGRVRDYFFGNLNMEFADRTFVSHNQRYNEVWVSYPSLNSTDGSCDMALIYSYDMDNWTERELPSVAVGSYGPSITAGEFNLNDLKLVLPSVADDDLKRMDDGDTFSGAAINGVINRNSLSVDQQFPATSFLVDDITFVMTGDGTSEITVQSTDKLNEVIDLDNASDIGVQSVPFDLSEGSVDLSFHPRVNGKFLNLRIQGSNPWSLHHYVVDYSTSDERSR